MLDVAPSMYEEDGGTVVLAEWATNGRLAEATAAQLGFDHAPDGPFCGRRGRTRLAVVDGHVTEDLARILVARLGPDERLSLVGVGLDPAADAALATLRPGSRARAVPRDILLAYRSPSAWRVAASPLPEPDVGDQLVLESAPPAEADAEVHS